MTHSGALRVPPFCSHHILTSSVISYWTNAGLHGSSQVLSVVCWCAVTLKSRLFSNFFRPSKVYKIRGSLERGVIQKIKLTSNKNFEKFQIHRTILLTRWSDEYDFIPPGHFSWFAKVITLLGMLMGCVNWEKIAKFLLGTFSCSHPKDLIVEEKSNLHKIWRGETYHRRSAIESINVSFHVLIKKKS